MGTVKIFFLLTNFLISLLINSESDVIRSAFFNAFLVINLYKKFLFGVTSISVPHAEITNGHIFVILAIKP